ncbi:endonuclease/exonuclease/phosphatase family protein [Actinoallomurus iriomotensis]|uniref:Metal-dependent hydrolase n=1 Tax=Actinoallomurus iriomotensis TaxID=478107 RepID=A0A9W6RE21_9ACTN|nr:endonuclease/exonuclease/phosphatase family protein [Actinoallomurus iriomotensis]GLY73889.1 metal-dependent hydrolase [Actinoallomurus iriomotensis]
MRIISLNAWGGAVFDDLTRWLATCDTDILCLQEVTHTPTANGWTRFEDAERSLPQRADLLSDIRSLLPSHQALFTANDAGPVHDQTGGLHQQEFGLMALTAPGLPLVGIRSTFIHGAYVEYQSHWPAGDRPRAAQALRVFDRQAQRFVTVTHLHGLRDPNGKTDSPARRAQADRLADLITSVSQEGDLIVVCGDFNLLPNSETFQILAKLGLVDLVQDADTRTSRYPKPLRHASYMLVSEPSAVQRFEIIARPEVSDHRALMLDL